ncbi:MAG: hypothetical protein M3020_17610 [Myxococcota bacterium]|nr:hypothetical protein [Myxococcota bacterium]
MPFRVEAGPRAAVSPPGTPGGSAATPTKAEPSAFATTLESLARRVDAGESLVRRAVHGGGAGGLDPGQWIALQAGIYRYVEALDLAAKLVDRAGNAVRTVLQGGH